MPLLSPSQIHSVLRESALPAPKSEKGNFILNNLLLKHSLTADDALERLSAEMQTGDTSATRIRATETALKLNGLLDSSENKPDFHVTINILDSEFSQCNPILIPR